MLVEENEPMFGWLICRFDKKQIHSILYGQFSRLQTPPPSGWVFLAKDAAEEQKETDIVKLPREGLEGKSLSLFAKGIDSDDIAGCINASLSGSADAITVNAAFLQSDRDPTATPSRYYVVRNCPIPAVNGRYMEGGFHEDAPLYRNVREWAIVRTKLQEIPELGISAKGSYAIQEGTSISEIYHEAAASAYEEILASDPSGPIKDGSYHFKKRFIALSRAGNRMVTGDQALQLDFVNRKRAALRSELSANLLLSLQEARADIAAQAMGDTHQQNPPTAKTGPSAAEREATDLAHKQPLQAQTQLQPESQPQPRPTSGALFSRSQVPHYMNETLESCAPDTIKTGSSPANKRSSATLAEGQPFPTSASPSSPATVSPREQKPAQGQGRMDPSEVGVEIDITLGRSITYQRGGQGYVLNRLADDSPGPDAARASARGSAAHSGELAADEQFLDAEAELAHEVVACIEQREAALDTMRWEAARLRKAFVEGRDTSELSQLNDSLFSTGHGLHGDGSAERYPPSALNTARSHSSAVSHASRASTASAGYYYSKVQDLLGHMGKVRQSSLAFAEAFGAWARLLHKQKAAKWRREKKRAEQFGGSFKRMGRSYTVVIAQRSAKELYALSQPVKSNVKKFSRGMEPVKYATDIKVVGVFETREEAEAAFDRAYNEIPQEYLLLADVQAVNKKLIGLRRCGQHYWIHSSGVPQDLPCELCRMQQQAADKAAREVPELYKEEPVSQFIWKGANYLEKMWGDCDFLADVEYLQRALPSEDFRANPLLLSNASVRDLLNVMHEHKYGHKSDGQPRNRNRTAQSLEITSSSSGVGGEVRGKEFQPTGNPRHPLNQLRGQKELLRDAARAGDAENALRRQRDFDAQYADNPYNNTANFGSLTKRRKTKDADAERDVSGDGHLDNSPEATAEQQTRVREGSDAVVRAAHSVFLEPSSEGKYVEDSEFGEPVHLPEDGGGDEHERVSKSTELRRGADSSALATPFGHSHLPSHSHTPPTGSLLTMGMRSSQSAPTLPAPLPAAPAPDHAVAAAMSKRRGPRATSELKPETVLAYSSKSTMAGNGAVAVKNINKARAGSGSAAELALMSKAGLDLNRYLPKEGNPSNLATGSRLGSPPQLRSAPPLQGIAEEVPDRWDSDFLFDEHAQRERLARALQVIGQCPVPQNQLRSEEEIGTGSIAGTPHSPFLAHATAVSANRQQTQVIPTSDRAGSGATAASSPSPTSSASATALPAGMTLVETFYSYRGAQMSLLQQRVAPAFRSDDVFCRSDVGEWAGLRKGRAMRAFEFQENLYRTGKEKEENRKRVQQLLRDAAAVDIITCDVPYTEALIDEARQIKGSMLKLDIAAAELFLRHFHLACKYALRGQSWFRGERDRRRVTEMKRKIKEQKRHRRTTEIESAKLAPLWVAELLKSCVEKKVRQERRSVFRFTCNLSGVLCMASLRRQPLPSRKPISPSDLCAGCNTACVISKWEPRDRSTSRNRAPCTCTMVTPQEQWQLNIYNPLLRETRQLVLSVAQVRQMLRGIERAAHTMRSEAFARASLVGTDFGELQPLFGGLEGGQEGGDAFNGRRLDKSYSNALLKAAAESAVLPRLPRLLPEQLSRILANDEDHGYVATAFVRTDSTGPALMVAGYDNPLMTDSRGGAAGSATGQGSWTWHPVSDLVRVRREAERCRVLVQDFHLRALAAQEEVAVLRKEAAAAAVEVERVHMEFEDARSSVARVSELIIYAAERIVEVMQFSKRLLQDVTAEEQQQQLDYKQSYDGMEDAGAWMGLNDKRRLERQHASLFADCQAKASVLAGVEAAHGRARAALEAAEIESERRLQEWEQVVPVVPRLEKHFREVSVYTRAAADAVLRTYSLPRRIPPPAHALRPVSSRRLQRVPWNLVFVRDALERLRFQNRGALVVLQRKVMKLVPMQSTLDARLQAHLRCVVLLVLDELTGNMLVHVGREGASVEESNQHTDLDLQKGDFSDLTSHGLDNEITLLPEDVDWLLSIPVEMSAENLKRAEKIAQSAVRDKNQKGRGSAVLIADPNKLPLGENSAPAVLVPSQALRPLSGVRAVPALGARLLGLPPTYLARRNAKEQAQVKRGERLLQYLRLQAHTGRPCVGLLHFRRRLTYSHARIKEASWLSDLVNADPLVLVNHLRSSQFLLDEDTVTVHLYATLRRFNVDIQLPFPAEASTLHVEVPLSTVLHSLVPNPLLLASFLWQVVTNRFTPQSLAHLFRCVDYEVPGHLRGSYWRHPFKQEVPRPRFEPVEAMRFRGPVYRKHRFVSSRYFLAELHFSAQKDVRIVLREPVDGKFYNHGYRGSPLFVHIARHELCALVAKVAVVPGLVPASMVGSLLVLHPRYRHVLFVLLLEVLHLSLLAHGHDGHHHHHHYGGHHHHHHEGHHRHHHHHHHHHHHQHHHNHSHKDPMQPLDAGLREAVHGQCVLPSLTDTGTATGGHFEVAVNLGPLCDALVLAFDKFNHWCAERNNHIVAPLPPVTLAQLHLQFARLSAAIALSPTSTTPSDVQELQQAQRALYDATMGEVPYTVRCERDPSNKQQMRVFHSVWSFLDLDRFYGDPVQPLRRKGELLALQRSGGAPVSLLRSIREFEGPNVVEEAGVAGRARRLRHFPSYTLGEGCLDSLMEVAVLTNISKTRLLIEISTIDLEHKDAASIVGGHEVALMCAEDEQSHTLRSFAALDKAKRRLHRAVATLRTQLYREMLPRQEALEREAEHVASAISTLKRQFINAHRKCLERHALLVSRAALLRMQGSDGDESALWSESAAAAALRSIVAPVKVPLHLQHHQGLMALVNWVNDTLRRLHHELPAVTPESIQLHHCSVTHGSTQFTERPTELPPFSSASLPRRSAVNAVRAPELHGQLGCTFRDPDHWYIAKRHRPPPPICQPSQPRPGADGDGRSEDWEVVETEASSERPVGLQMPHKGLRIVRGNALKGHPLGDLLVQTVVSSQSGLVRVGLQDSESQQQLSVFAFCGVGISGERDSAQAVVQFVRRHRDQWSSACSSLDGLVSAVQAEAREAAEQHAVAVTGAAELLQSSENVYAELHSTLDHTSEAGRAVLMEAAKAIVEISAVTAESGVDDTTSGAGMSLAPAVQEEGLTPVGTPSWSRKKPKGSSKRARSRARAQSDSSSELAAESNTVASSPYGMLGFCVPRDESLPVSVVRAVSCGQWRGALAQLIPGASDPTEVHVANAPLRLLRHTCSFGLLYFLSDSTEEPALQQNKHHHHHIHGNQDGQSTEETVNQRVMRLLQLFDTPAPHSRSRPHTSTGSKGAQVTVTGDVVLMLRHGERQFPELEAALLQMQAEYEPMRQLRLQKEGRERQWRLDNHQKYRLLAYGLAFPLLRAVECMYAVLRPSLDGAGNPFPAPVPSVAQLSAYQTRLLLTKFDDLLELQRATNGFGAPPLDSGTAGWWKQLQYLGLLDRAVVAANEELLALYDEACPTTVDFGAFERRDPRLRAMLVREKMGDDQHSLYLSREDSAPQVTVGQLVYAMFQLHCYNCTLPTNTCTFPGCGAIRCRAAALTAIGAHTRPYLGALNCNDAAEMSLHRGSGLHPVDCAIRAYMGEQRRRLFTKDPPLRLSGRLEEQGDIGVAEEAQLEAAQDLAVVRKYDKDQQLSLRWRELQEESAYFFALHNALVRPEVALALSAKDLLLARGGAHAQSDLAAIRKVITKTLVTQSAAANSDYKEYDCAAAGSVVRLVPSAAMLAEQARHAQELAAAEVAARLEARAGILEEEEEGQRGGSGSDGEGSSSRSGSKSGSYSGSSSSSGSSDSGSQSGSESASDDSSALSEGTSASERRKGGKRNKGIVVAAAPVKQTHSIPIDILRALSASAIAMYRSSGLPAAFDPYPSVKPGWSDQAHAIGRGVSNAMPESMYRLLMQRLRLTRGDRMPAQPKVKRPKSALPVSRPSSSQVSQRVTAGPIDPATTAVTADYHFRFDRLHHEQAAVLQDGSAVLIQCLHGVLQGASLVVVHQPVVRTGTRRYIRHDVFPNIELVENASGAPPAAVRFLDTAKLPTLNPGMTVVVFDILSTVSRAFIIEERSLQRTCEAFRVPVDNLGLLARRIGELAHRCIQLTRAGHYCTTVMFTVASLYEADEVVAEEVSREEAEQSDVHCALVPSPPSPSSPLLRSVHDADLLASEKSALCGSSALLPTAPQHKCARYHKRPGAALSRFAAISDLLAEDERA